MTTRYIIRFKDDGHYICAFNELGIVGTPKLSIAHRFTQSQLDEIRELLSLLNIEIIGTDEADQEPTA